MTAVRNGNSVWISQQRYILPKLDVNDTSRWFIPITYETQANRTQAGIPSYWLSNSQNITLPNVVDPEHWFYLNIKRAGYYRVNYDYKSWIILLKNYEQVPPAIQAQLVDDSLHLARAEIVSYDVPLTFLMKLGTKDILPWAAANDGIQYLTQMMNREPAYEHFRVSPSPLAAMISFEHEKIIKILFQAIMRYILRQIYQEMGFDEIESETHVQLMHRQRIIKLSCFFGEDRCTNRAQYLFREWMRDRTLNL